MARTQYRDREGKAISEAQWKKLQADTAYKTVKEYDNGVVRVTLQWNGRIEGAAASTYAEYWPVFILLVKKYKQDGTLVNDPGGGGRAGPAGGAGGGRGQ